ncbi:MAG: type II secretion system protein [Pseudomonas prosekii]|uniref:Type II secretory pathway, pseudopilin PulG n=2 Tax=Pseudomonas prosekii TaxID=1148509 RepID=A0A3L8CBF6_9PSED|nr:MULTISPECIES: type II secretion system protein [Pseudomonas]RLU04981.1 type II secretory pathway, pseudopilin PulG [Pseudomonas prosekii]RLU11669.1 type II secretory pathway, pseudopilin PulG [Pseudomonas prosekii]TWD50372.1 type II secretory pathway pseudopilin PulG [Pseudomonas sp. SJZ131]
MAAFIPSGKPAGEGGFTYLGVLFLVALMGMGLASAGQVWSTASKRDRERQLLWVGTQYAQALRSYYRSSPGVAQYPKELADLLQDERFPSAKHHLRQLYPDPMGGGEWSLMRGFDGRITGLYSAATDTPLKQTDFPTQWSDFVGMASYKDWQFVAEKAFLEGASGPTKAQSAKSPGVAP